MSILQYVAGHAFVKFLEAHEFLVRYWQKLEYPHVQDALFLVHRGNTPLPQTPLHAVGFLQNHQIHHHHSRQYLTLK